MPSSTTKRKDTMEADQPPRKVNKRQKTKRQTKFKLDPNTANGSLSLSENNKVATYTREKQSHPEHPERFSFWQQVLCTEGLTGRWHWEVEVSGWVSVAVAYQGLLRGAVDSSLLGYNSKSWALVCAEGSYTACHNKQMIEYRGSRLSSSRIAVTLDTDEGDLTFYGFTGSEYEELHSFHAAFTGPLYPAFRLGWSGSSVSLLHLTENEQ